MSDTLPASARTVGRGPARMELARYADRTSVIIALWVGATVIHFVDTIFVSGEWEQVIWVPQYSTLPVFSALMAGAFIGSRIIAWHLMTVYLAFNVVFALLHLVYGALSADSNDFAELALIAAACPTLAVCLMLWRGLAGRVSQKRLVAAMASVAALGALAAFPEKVQALTYEALVAANGASGDEDERIARPRIEADRLWQAQPRLLEAATRLFPTSRSRPERTYLAAVAAMGTQNLFGREAAVALQTLKQRYVGSVRMASLLSNAQDDLLKTPLATVGNIESVVTAASADLAPARDLVIIYLTSHGSREATLSTDLPDYTALQPISAADLAAQLDRTRIRRRVIIVSACFSGSWIKPLANDDTIIITAAAAGRSSFGCSDDRQLTYFGEALLHGSLGTNASLADVFASTARTVARMEQADKLKPSMPQAFVGKNMQAYWRAKPN